jgi:hypothetical protein
MLEYNYTVLFEPAEEGGYVVTCPALLGLVTRKSAKGSSADPGGPSSGHRRSPRRFARIGMSQHFPGLKPKEVLRIFEPRRIFCTSQCW